MQRHFKFLAILALLLLPATLGQAGEPDKMAQADAMMRGHTLDLQQAQQALSLYEEFGRQEANASLLMRLARTAFVLGDLAPKEQRAGYYDRGLAYAERLLKQEPRGVAGHYWRAMNLCGLADVGGRFQGFKLPPRIMAELKEALSLDETYDEAGAHRVLGRIYFEAPAWPVSVGYRKKSLQHLSAAVRLAPDNSTNHLYLAETLLDQGNKTQAREELQKVFQAKRHAIQPQGLAADRLEARRLLAEMKGGQ